MKGKLLLLLAALLVSIPVAKAIKTLKPGGGDAELEAFCRNGGKGVGYDATTGLYDATCILGWDTADIFDYQDCTDVATPDHACYASGERLLVDGWVHAFYAAAEATVPYGTVWFSKFPDKDHGLYVYRGCGARDCPTFEQSLSDVSLRPAYRVRNITAYKGLKIRGLGGDPDGPFANGRTGVYLLHDAGQQNDDAGTEKTDGDGEGLGTWVFRLGAINGINTCYSTELGGGEYSDACDFDHALSLASDSPKSSRMGRYIEFSAHCDGGDNDGVFCDADADCTAGGGTCEFDVAPSFATYDGNRNTRICFFNDDDFDEQGGVCDGDVRTLCNSAVNDRTGVSSGGCDFSGETPAGNDRGDCVPMIDAVEGLQDAGEQIILMCKAKNFDIDGNPASIGETVAYFPILDVADPGTCGTDGRYMLLGVDTTQDMTWPFYKVFDDVDDVQCNVVRADWLDNGNGYNYEGINFSPVDYYGRDISGDDSNDCDAGTEDECDSAAMIGLVGGTNGGMVDVGIWGCSQAGTKSCIDGASEALFTKMHKLSIKDCKRGMISDASNWLFENVDIDRCSASDQVIFNAYSSTSHFRNITVGNSSGAAFIRTQAPTGILVDMIKFRGGNDFIYGTYDLRGGHGIRITNNLVESLSGRFVMLNPTDDTVLSDVLIAGNVAYGGPNAPWFTDGWGGTRARAWIAATDMNEAHQGEIRNVVVRENSVLFDSLSDVCFAYFDIGDDGAAGGAGRNNIGTEDYIQEFTFKDNSIRGTGAELTCIGDDGSIDDERASETDRVWAANRWPYMEGNDLNDTQGSDYPYHMRAAAAAGDCDDLPTGTLAVIYDDTAVGACTDSTSDGVLDGGGSDGTISVCECREDTLWRPAVSHGDLYGDTLTLAGDGNGARFELGVNTVAPTYDSGEAGIDVTELATDPVSFLHFQDDDGNRVQIGPNLHTDGVIAYDGAMNDNTFCFSSNARVANNAVACNSYNARIPIPEGETWVFHTASIVVTQSLATAAEECNLYLAVSDVKADVADACTTTDCAASTNIPFAITGDSDPGGEGTAYWVENVGDDYTHALGPVSATGFYTFMIDKRHLCVLGTEVGKPCWDETGSSDCAGGGTCTPSGQVCSDLRAAWLRVKYSIHATP